MSILLFHFHFHFHTHFLKWKLFLFDIEKQRGNNRGCFLREAPSPCDPLHYKLTKNTSDAK